MRRRDFMAGLCGAAAAPVVARAQTVRLRRVGVLWPYPANDATDSKRLDIFIDALRRLGWVEGRTLKVDFRRAVGGEASLRPAAKELVTLSPDVIVVSTTAAAIAVRRATDTIPIVFVIGFDPVGQGLVANLAHPGGNVTGFPNYDATMSGKLLELFKEVAPRVERVAAMFNPATAPQAPLVMQSLESVAPTLSLTLTAAPVHDRPDIETTVAALGRDRANGLFVMPDLFMGINRHAIVDAAARFKVPAVYAYPYFAAIGGLIGYGVDIADLYRRAAEYVDRILKGAKPADLPVQNPTKFELAINLKTAKALSLTVPPSLLAQADEVIE